MVYSDGRAPAETDEFTRDFYNEHGDISGMSPDQFATLVGLSSARYESLPYHGYAHPMQVMWDAASLIKKFGLKLSPENQAGLIVGSAYHDVGESNPAEERHHKSPEEFSIVSMYQDQDQLGFEEDVMEIAKKCIAATTPGRFKHREPEPRILVRADIANVLSGDINRMAEATKQLVDEGMLKEHQDHEDFSIEAFIRMTTSALTHYLQRDLSIHHKDEWSKESTAGIQRVNTQIPYIARNHFNDIARVLGHQLNDGIYPYRATQGSSSVVTPAPWTGSPDPSIAS